MFIIHVYWLLSEFFPFHVIVQEVAKKGVLRIKIQATRGQDRAVMGPWLHWNVRWRSDPCSPTHYNVTHFGKATLITLKP